ncbi:hypothetical protein JW721_04905 [Candidatus Micrarchaeota archaeon]|nr:hypothetical protein [Candidatus Micrarchaeota archaeon]
MNSSSPPSDGKLKAMILHKLAKKRKWGESHTALETTSKGVPSHLRGKMKELTEELVRDGFITPKPTGYGTHISLSVSRSEEIKAIIKEYLRIEL